MNLEKGEYFAITRGVKLASNTNAFSVMMPWIMDNEQWKLNGQEDEPRYDRSFHDVVFQAVEVCWPMVAAKAVAGDKYWVEKNLVLSLNLSEIEIMTLTKEYVAAFPESKL